MVSYVKKCYRKKGMNHATEVFATPRTQGKMKLGHQKFTKRKTTTCEMISAQFQVCENQTRSDHELRKVVWKDTVLLMFLELDARIL